ncbi:hypothetical protein BB559_001855 [Furculomyces boomerangus]|uniref:Uncharacterized protein n=1 Tax=Furculomyces boomerangus TaxID=61424 RepID=A0A2T9Z050_9FUNG|nr:hypothetical protein BB559_001855 [Furculomyces boomerangus]
MPFKNHTPILLGFPDGLQSATDSLDPFISKLGGIPTWLQNNQATEIPTSEFAHCGNCNDLMILLFQIYAPLENSPFERVLYLWGCTKKSCMKNPNSFKAIRGQYINKEYLRKLYPDPVPETSNKNSNSEPFDLPELTNKMEKISISPLEKQKTKKILLSESKKPWPKILPHTSELYEVQELPKGVDKYLQHFLYVVGQNPEQCIRYQFDGIPLVYTNQDNVSETLGLCTPTTTTQHIPAANDQKKGKKTSLKENPHESNFDALSDSDDDHDIGLDGKPQIVEKKDIDESNPADTESIKNNDTLVENSKKQLDYSEMIKGGELIESLDLGMEFGTVMVYVCKNDCYWGTHDIFEMQGSEKEFMEPQYFEEILSTRHSMSHTKNIAQANAFPTIKFTQFCFESEVSRFKQADISELKTFIMVVIATAALIHKATNKTAIELSRPGFVSQFSNLTVFGFSVLSMGMSFSLCLIMSGMQARNKANRKVKTPRTIVYISGACDPGLFRKLTLLYAALRNENANIESKEMNP